MKKTAEELFLKGYNCAQAVFCAYCKEFDIDFETGAKLASSFGGGMGRLREVCGAISAMFMLAGLKYGYFQSDCPEKKTQHYKLIQQLALEFKKEHGSIICKELLNENSNGYIPDKRTDEYYKTRPCIKFIQTVSKIIEEKII